MKLSVHGSQRSQLDQRSRPNRDNLDDLQSISYIQAIPSSSKVRQFPRLSLKHWCAKLVPWFAYFTNACYDLKIVRIILRSGTSCTEMREMDKRSAKEQLPPVIETGTLG
jgi:hypothetical protein